MSDMKLIVEGYIKQCNDIIEQCDIVKAKKIQGIIISALKCEIPDIDSNLDRGFINFNGPNRDPRYIENIEKITSRLGVFLANLSQSKKQEDNKGINIQLNNNNTNNNSMELMFEKAREEIENNESMSEGEINEILEKINEIESISKSDEAKNKKWFKLRPTMEWLGTKGVSVATAILGLITAILKMNN